MQKTIKFTIFLLSFLISSNTFALEPKAMGSEKDPNKDESVLKYLLNDPNDKSIPPYRKTFDEYIVDAEYIRKYGKMPPNPIKDEDLAKANYDGIIHLQ